MSKAEPLGPDDPSVVGPYRLSGRLGMGGQGVVYLGHGVDGTPVAVKVLRQELAADIRVRERFTKELAAAARVDPFCIAQVLDASLDGQRPYIVTEYIQGPSLQQAGPRKGAALQRLAVATATALAAIHEAGVVHRDFKPSNVLLGPDGPRVIDFGIARDTESPLTLTNSIIGTPAYMAPEQFAGQSVGPPADVFAWGAVISYAAAGKPPFGTDTFPAIMNRVLNGEPDLGELPEPLRSTVQACLAKEPGHRPPMQAVLLRLLGAQPRPTGPQTAPTGPPPVSTSPPPAPTGTQPPSYSPGPVQAGSPQGPTGIPHAAPAGPPPMPAGAQTPAGPQMGLNGGGTAGRRKRRPAVLFGAGAAGALAVAVAVAVAAVIWGGLDTSGATVDNRDGSSNSESNAQGLGPGAPAQPGTDASAGPSGRPSPSASPGPNTRGGRGASGTPRDSSGPGGGDGGGGGGGTAPRPTNPSGSSAPSGPSARISYFTVGSAGTCYAKGQSFPFRYSIVGSKNPTPIEFSIYFDGRLGAGHPINTVGEPDFTISTDRSESTAGTHTYRMVLRSPTHQEKTVTVKVC
ncbi:hypothetical protein GCM10009780_70980 [Actinomadura alba]|nr:serine/threonine-protein kinase [Actinomadura alba]